MRRYLIVLLVSLFVPAVVIPKETSSRTLTVTATGYCSGPCDTCQTTGKTSTGRSAYKDGIAVEPRAIPYGSHIDLPDSTHGPNGNGSWVRVDDTGAAMRKAWEEKSEILIDIRFQSHSDAKAYGKKKIKVRVWE